MTSKQKVSKKISERTNGGRAKGERLATKISEQLSEKLISEKLANEQADERLLDRRTGERELSQQANKRELS